MNREPEHIKQLYGLDDKRCDHFADHLRLAEAPRERAHQPAHGQDDGHLKEEGNRKLRRIHLQKHFGSLATQARRARGRLRPREVTFNQRRR